VQSPKFKPHDTKIIIIVNQEAIREQAWWCTPVIPAATRLRQGGCELQAALGYMGNPISKNKTKQTTPTTKINK
jgi:hypothetical protein